MCKHVLTVHKTGRAPAREDGGELLDAATLRGYIARAKQYNPWIPVELTGVPLTVLPADSRMAARQLSILQLPTGPCLNGLWLPLSFAGI